MTLTDKEIIDGLTGNDEQVIRYFFYEKCKPMIGYIIKEIFTYRVEKDELINELYIYLQVGDWHKLRQFDCRSKLTTWLSVVAVRFFQKKRNELIENPSRADQYIQKEGGYDPQDMTNLRMDIKNALDQMTNERYREVIHALFFEDMEPQDLADRLGVTIDNLYNIKRRALMQLMQIFGRKSK